ncbi:MAG: hypothetical protein PHQ52_03645 [Candidatus Omnitrophica bacterium]|nr:hypothetical protein [Candidatus Omnitrophota bacterium]
MKLRICLLSVLVLCLLFTSNYSFGQDETVVEDPSSEYTWGSVVSVSANEIVVSKFDYDTQEIIQITYPVDAEVEIENAAAISDIKEGDMVDIMAVLKGDQMVVTSISVDNEDAEEPVMENPSESGNETELSEEDSNYDEATGESLGDLSNVSVDENDQGIPVVQ